MADDLHDFRALCDAVFDGRADEDQLARLEQLVLGSEELRRLYVQYAHEHAALSWLVLNQPATGSGDREPGTLPGVASTRRRPRLTQALSRGFAAAGLLALIVFGLVTDSGKPVATFATLERIQNARWSESTLPIGEGARLSSGRMQLSDGMATIDFDKGVKIVVEAPAVFELVDANQCHVHQGKIRAEVRPGGEGFIVRTPTATLIDRGTVFGVHVQVGGVSDLMVFKGKVDASHPGTGRTVSATTGTGLRLTTSELEIIPDENAPITLPAGPLVEPETQETIQISTAIGRGMDAYIQPFDPPADRRSDVLLLLKRNNRRLGGEQFYDWHRKAYLRFDLSFLHEQDIESAKLELQADRSGMGFASHCPDATFVVYGLTDETRDAWGDEKLAWENAPGNFPDGHSMDASRTTRLGEFVVPQGVCSGTFGIQSAELVKFLRRDTNGLATLIIVRETLGTGTSDIVHAFASRRHPTLPAPMLRLTTAPAPATSQIVKRDRSALAESSE